MACYLLTCVCCFRTTAHAHSWCGSPVYCYANPNYARNLCSVCNTKCSGYCAKPPTFLKRQLIKTLWQLYKKQQMVHKKDVNVRFSLQEKRSKIQKTYYN